MLTVLTYLQGELIEGVDGEEVEGKGGWAEEGGHSCAF